MIRPLNTPQLSSAKPRTGLQSVADLIPRLIRQYEMTEMMRGVAAQPALQDNIVTLPTPIETSDNPGPTQQVTFGWYQ